jgi:WD40-like Beta Propeller Repeat
MSEHVSRLPLALDPLIAEAKRRARQRRFLVALGAVILVGLAAGLTLGLPSSGGGTSGGLKGAGSAGTLTIPTGTDGIAAIVYGRLSVSTKTGFHLQGLPVSAASLSPGARYVAAGEGHSLVELAPSGRQVWSRRVGGPVTDCGACNVVASITWSPDGSRIAYVVRTPTRKQVLHVIWRDGTHDTVINRNARPGQPSWRADSQAVAYVGAGTRPVIYDLRHRSHQVIRWALARSPSIHLAFAPHGNELAIGTETAALLVGDRHWVVWRGQTWGVGWLAGRLAVSARVGIAAHHSHYVAKLYSVTQSGATLRRSTRLPAPILATHRRTIALDSGRRVLAGHLGSLQKVLRFRLKPCHGSFGAWVCQIPIGNQDISIG